MIKTEMEEELHIMLGRISVLIWQMPLYEMLKAYIFGYFVT